MRNNRSGPKNWQEIRRFRAYELKKKGWKQREIAEALGVTEGAVSQWLSIAEQQGKKGLLLHPRPGAPARLTKEEIRLIPDYLSHGAEAYGFRGEVWTCARVAAVIKQEFGVSYHKAHVSRLLKVLEWTPQKPIERAKQRDEAEIARKSGLN